MGQYADWPELVAHYRAQAEVIREGLASESLDEDDGFTLLSAFSGTDQPIAIFLAVEGAGCAREPFATLYAHLERAAACLAESGFAETRAAQSVANLAVLAECMGFPPLAGITSDVLKALVRVREELTDAEQRSVAFTALALGDPATARAAVDAEDGTFDQPVASLEFNLYGVVRYLAAAIEDGRPASWVEPLWDEYLALYPWHLAADAAEWMDLLCFARVVARFRGDEVGTVADEVHRRVMRLSEG